jgi:hypothetical protein
MKIFYYGSARNDIPLIAGYIHLQKLPLDSIPATGDIYNAFSWCNVEPHIAGVPLYLGDDESNNEVYIVGFEKNYKYALQTITNIHMNTNDWKFYSTLSEENIFTGLGRFFLTHLQLVYLGTKLTAFGVRRNYIQLIKLVKKVKELNQIG